MLGATGHVGRIIVQQALQQGHRVTALVRHPEKLTVSSPNLTIQQGSVRDPATIAAAMTGADAVLSALGHNSLKTSDVQTAATRAVLANLTPRQRFITLTGVGVGDPHDPHHPLSGNLVTLALKLVPGRLFQDAQAAAALLRASTTNWVLLRAPIMTNARSIAPYRLGYYPVSLTTTVARTDVANAMLANLATDTWLRQAPIVISGHNHG